MTLAAFQHSHCRWLPKRCRQRRRLGRVHFFSSSAPRGRVPARMLPKKSQVAVPAAFFLSLLTIKGGTIRRRRSEQSHKCASVPSDATVGAKGGVGIVFLIPLCFLSGVPVPTS